MKRYLLFQGACYYPKGGSGDLNGSFDSIDEAKARFKAPENKADIEWGEIYDQDSEQLVCLTNDSGQWRDKS